MPDAAAGFALSQVGVQVEGATLLQDVTLELPAGRWTALVGPSGSGKSTLLRLLNRLLEPSVGELRYRGAPLSSYDVRELRRRVGLVVQQAQLSAGSARDNLDLPVRLGALSAAEADVRRPQAMAVAQLDTKLLEREVSALSGGERQRVALARACMLRPEVLLLDEPTSALDPDTARRVLEALETLRRETDLTLVVVTHRIDEVGRLDPDSRCAVLSEGRLVETGLATDVLARPQHAVTRSLLGRGLHDSADHDAAGTGAPRPQAEDDDARAN